MAACLVPVNLHAREGDLLDNIRWWEDPDSTISISVENDFFANEDNGYTNGVRLAWVSSESRVPGWLENAANSLPFFASEGRKRYGFALGQNIFTPNDILRKNPDPNDRPYAGWTYGSVGIVSDTGYRMDNLQLTLGIVGPSAQGEASQDFVHHIIDDRDPQGWDRQLKDEPGFILTYERTWRGLYEFSPFGYGMDITPHLGGSVGNVHTYASAGTTVRIGKDLPSDYGPPRVRPSLPGSDFFTPTQELGWYLFAGAEGRAVARNIFLDGNTFRDSASVDKKNFVGDLQAGAAITWRQTRLAYTHVFRTPEFRERNDTESFGAITLSTRF